MASLSESTLASFGLNARGFISPQVVLVAVTCHHYVIMAPQQLALRRAFRRRVCLLATILLLCGLLGAAFVVSQFNQAGFYDNMSLDSTFHEVNNRKFLLRPKLQSSQYYLNKANNLDSADLNPGRNVGHNLEWGYDDLINGLVAKPKCSSKDSLLLILITSASGNFDRRSAIRNSWCSAESKKSVKPTLPSTPGQKLDWQCVFLIGRDPNSLTNQKVREESQLHSDILLGDFMDSYRNLSLKVLTALHWSRHSCPLQFVLKTDDDCFVNVHLLPEFLLAQSVAPAELYAGNAADQERRAHVIRDPTNKWSVSRDEYAPDLYPPYASGTGYVLSQDVLSRLLLVSRHYKPFPNEDAYVGVLVDQLGLEPVHSSRFTLYSDAWTTCNFRYLLVIHHVTVAQQRDMLRIAERARSECADQRFIREWN